MSTKIASHRRSSRSPKAQPSTKLQKSAEFVHDSSEDNLNVGSSSSEQSPNPASKNSSPVQRIQGKVLTSHTKSNSKRTIKNISAHQKLRSPSPSSRDSSSEKSDDDDDSSVSNRDAGEAAGRYEVPGRASGQEKQKVVQSSTVRVATPYRPPPNFVKTSIVTSKSSNLADIFAPSSLQSKQIWHITVPQAVPIDSIKDLAAKSVQDGTSILSHKGVEWVLVQDEQSGISKDTLLLPCPKSNDFRDTRTGIFKTLHLQQLARPPNLSGSSQRRPEDAQNPPVVYKKAIRQQPTGLRMRYRPFGDLDSSSSENPDSAPRFHAPPNVEAFKTVGHGRQEELNHQQPASISDAGVFVTPKSAKKKRDHNAVNSDVPRQEEPTSSSKAKRDKKSKTKGQDRYDSPANKIKDSQHTDLNKENSSQLPATSSSHTEIRTDTGDTMDVQQYPTDIKPVDSEANNNLHDRTETSPISAPSTTKPSRSNEEKRRRKAEKRLRREAREPAAQPQSPTNP